MKSNFSLILLLFFLLGCSFSPKSTVRTNDDQQHTIYKYEYALIEFKELNKNIWVLDTDERALKFKTSFDRLIPTRSHKSLKYKINEQISFEANGIQIEVCEADVFLNGEPMGKNLNSIIDSQGRVRMGAFYRTFE